MLTLEFGNAYYNEFDPVAAEWLRRLIKAGHIAPGYVDESDIRNVRPNELLQFKQVHLFAGRVGKLRAYGNGLDAEMAKEFVGTVMEIIKVDGCCGRKITDSAGEFEWSDFNIPRFKRLGVLAGIPDLVIIKPGGNVYLLELKAGKGSLQDSQNATRQLDIFSTVQARAVA